MRRLARRLVEERNRLKEQIRERQPSAITEQQEERNIQKYGDPVGPTPEWLNQHRYTTWQEVIDAAYRTDPETNRALGLGR